MSDKYNVPDLTRKCEDILVQRLNRSNCLRAAVLGHMHKQEYLKDEVISIITFYFIEVHVTLINYNKALRHLVWYWEPVEDLPDYDLLEDCPTLRQEIADYILRAFKNLRKLQ